LYIPPGNLTVDSHQAVLTYPSSTGPQTRTWNFTVAGIACTSAPDAPTAADAPVDAPTDAAPGNESTNSANSTPALSAPSIPESQPDTPTAPSIPESQPDASSGPSVPESQPSPSTAPSTAPTFRPRNYRNLLRPF
jgi:hypothetical protein